MVSPSHAEPAEPAGTPLAPAQTAPAQTAPAQTAPAQTLPAPLATTPAPLPEILVVGPPAPRSASATSIPRAQLQAAPHHSGSDLLSSVPGLFITQHSGEGKAHQLFFRGYDAVHGQDIALDVAGVPVNETSNIHGQGYADLHFVIPEVVQRIDVLPGPFSAAQGDFAIAGSVHFALGVEEPGARVTAGLGTFGTRRGLLLYRPETASDQSFGAAEIYTTDGLGPARAAQRASALGQHVIALSPNDQLRLFAGVYAGRFESAGVVRLRDVEAGRIERYGTYDPDQGGFSSRAQLLAEWSNKTPSGESSLATYAALRSLRLRYDYTGALNNAPDLDNTLQAQDAVTAGLNGRLRRTLPWFDAKTALEAGISGRYDALDQSQRITSNARTLVDARINVVSAGGWVELLNTSFSRIALRAGLRADGAAFLTSDHTAQVERSSQGTHLGPKASIDVLAAPGLVASVAYGSGFRSPQARGLADGERAPFTDVQAVEAGARFSHAGFRASLAAFASYLDADLVFNETTSRNDAVSGTRRVGGALDLRYDADEQGLVSCGLTFTRATFRQDDGRYRKGELVPYVPQWVGRCDATYIQTLTQVSGAALRARLGAGANFLAQRPLPYGETGATALVTDVLAALEYRGVRLQLDVFNVFDTRWNDSEFVYASAFPGVPASSVPERHVTVGAPRSAFLSLSVPL